MKKGEIFEGLTVSTGVGIGSAYLMKLEKIEDLQGEFTSTSQEQSRFTHALDVFCKQTYDMYLKMKEILGEEDAMILGGQIHMARDLAFVDEIMTKIQEKNTAESAVVIIFDQYLSYFQEMEDEMMKQRGADLSDMKNHLLEILLGQEHEIVLAEKQNLILCVEELSPSMMPFLTPDRVSGIICQSGGVTSHCAILARATGIPAIFAVKNFLDKVENEDLLVVDGSTGQVVCNPKEQTLEVYQKKAVYFNKKRNQLEQFRQRKTKRKDGKSVALYANITDFAQIHNALELGAEGVGLFRTEYLFMGKQTLPSEDQQFRSYCRLAKMMEGNSVKIRTLDIGGDKQAPCLPLEWEENPFLGHRAVRFCLEQRDIFRTQIRAILRASVIHDNICIVVPFVTKIEEIQEVRQFIMECAVELKAEKIELATIPPLGIVVETPAAAILISQICRYVDYISVGTNDLTQYITASDRGNVNVAEYYNPFHPAVLQILKYIIHTCNENETAITLCGEAVADPRMIPLVLSFGDVSFSVSPSEILTVRSEISCWDEERLQEIKTQIFQFDTCIQVEEYLKSLIDEKDKQE